MVEVVRDSGSFGDCLPVFATEGFLRAKSDEYGWFRDKKFVLPFFVDKRLIFRRLVLTNEPMRLDKATEEEEKAFLNAVSDCCRDELKADFVATQANAVFDAVPEGCMSIDWGSYVVSLDGDEEALMKNIQARTRTKIRKAMRDNVVVEKTEDIVTIYDILKQTMDRQKELYYPSKGFLTRLKQNLGESAAYFFSRKNGEVQGGAVVLYNHLRAYYYFGGSVFRPYVGSVPLLHFEIMKYLQEKGVPVYDLMGVRLQLKPGSKFEGIQQFKRQLGAKLWVGKTFKAVFRPKRDELFNLMASVYFRLKGGQYQGDPIDQVQRLLRTSRYKCLKLGSIGTEPG